jgi:hypothetical protein
LTYNEENSVVSNPINAIFGANIGPALAHVAVKLEDGISYGLGVIIDRSLHFWCPVTWERLVFYKYFWDRRA